MGWLSSCLFSVVLALFVGCHILLDLLDRDGDILALAQHHIAVLGVDKFL